MSKKKHVELQTINVVDIEFGERAREDYGDLETLKMSIKKEGQIQPIAVMEQEGEKTFKLLAGGRRLKAITELGNPTIHARVYPSSLGHIESKSVELAENIYRQDLHWAEEIKLKDQIHTLQQEIHGVKDRGSKEGWGMADTGKLLGESAMNISRDIQLAKAVDSIPSLKTMKDKGEAAKLLKTMADKIRREEISDEIAKERAQTPRDKQRKQLIDSYIIGDAVEALKQVPTDSIDLIEIDPPYGIDLDEQKKSKDNLGLVTIDYIETKEYQELMFAVLGEAFRVVKADGWIIQWFGIQPWYQWTLEAMQNAGFLVRGIPAVWNKEHGQTNNPDMYLASAYEVFFHGRRTKYSKIRKMGRGNVFSYKPVPAPSKNHPTERPIEMMMDVLETFAEPGSKVWVPFLGSGNTILAANNLGMEASGTDLQKAYKDAYVLKVYDGVPGDYKSYRRLE